MIHPCDRQTDGRAIAYSALSIYAICCRALKRASSDQSVKWTETEKSQTYLLYTAGLLTSYKGRFVVVHLRVYQMTKPLNVEFQIAHFVIFVRIFLPFLKIKMEVFF